ncbi:hypothetical protein MRX96_011105 [Rhipicephalus microplus]
MRAWKQERRRGLQVDVRGVLASLFCSPSHAQLWTFLSYVTFLKSTYVSTIVSVDFEKHSDTVRGEINDWVKTVTESKIADLLAPGSVGPSTGVLLVNAVYFRGLWESPFPACFTSRRDFNVNSRTKVDMMCQKQAFAIPRNDDLGVRAIEMPYRGGRSSMVVVLPYEIDGLSHLEHHLSHGKLSNILGRPKGNVPTSK